MAQSFIERVWSIWMAGGWTMLPLCILSLLLYGSTVRMFLYFSNRDFHRIPESVWARWIKAPEEGQGEIGEIIRYTQDGVKSPSEIFNRFAEVSASKLPFIDRNIAYIGILVATAPLIGLLGTVMGMLLTFQSIGMGGGAMAAMMAKGISAALFPPEVGLCVALPGMLMLHTLKQKRNEYEAFLARLESLTIARIRQFPEMQDPTEREDPHTNDSIAGIEFAPSPA